MPCGIPPSALSGFVAALIGQLQGRIMSKVNELVALALAELQGQCPDFSGIKSLLKKRDNLLNAINGVEKKIQPVGDFANKMDKPLKAAKIIVTILEFLPIPTTIGTPPTGSPSDVGGQIYSMPTGKINRFGSLLRLACRIIEELQREQQAIKDLTAIGLGSLGPVKDKLQSIDFKLFECVNGLPQDQKDEITALIEFLPSNNGILNSVDEGNNEFEYTKPSSGIKYTIKVLEDKNTPEFAKRRYAAVFTQGGVEVLKGPLSFSSSTRILVDEIKFRINNQLP